MDLSKPRAFIEHPEHGTKMIYLEEREKYLSDGWRKPGGSWPEEIPTDDPVQQVYDELEECTISSPEKTTPLGEMTKDELNDYAAKNLPHVSITPKMSKYAALKKIQRALDDDSTENN